VKPAKEVSVLVDNVKANDSKMPNKEVIENFERIELLEGQNNWLIRAKKIGHWKCQVSFNHESIIQ